MRVRSNGYCLLLTFLTPETWHSASDWQARGEYEAALFDGPECGVIGETYPGMQMASFDPTIVDPHSPHERVKISTVADFWKYFKAVLKYF